MQPSVIAIYWTPIEMRIFIHKHYKKRNRESKHNLLIASKCCACCRGDVFKRYLSPPTLDCCRPHKLQSTCSWGTKSSKLQEKEKKSWAHKSFSHVLSVRGAKTHGNSAGVWGEGRTVQQARCIIHSAYFVGLATTALSASTATSLSLLASCTMLANWNK